jgi:hypothetical protein
MDEAFEKQLAELTEDDAGFKNERDYRMRHNNFGRGAYTLDDYRDHLRQRERDDQQMIDMGR